VRQNQRGANRVVVAFADDQDIVPLSQQLAQNTAERLVVLDDEHSVKGRQ
jgi:hypothetical protein